MSPIRDRDANTVRRLIRLFSRHLLDVAIIDAQHTLVLGRRDAPQPALLVVEVADASLAYDRDVKGAFYARTGIPEFWLVNLATDRIDVCRQPIADHYADVRTVSRSETLSPLHFPNVTFALTDILG